jgi:hypothetical protein
MQPSTTAGVAVNQIPEIVVRKDNNDISVQIRVQQVANGFLVRTGKAPVFYSTIDETAAAISSGIVQIVWPQFPT